MSTPEQIQAAIGVAPQLDPQTAVAAAVASVNNLDAVKNASMAASYGITTNLVDNLHKAPVSTQQSYFNSIPKQQQNQLVSAGYTPPPDMQTTHPVSFWGHMLNAGKSALSTVGRAINAPTLGGKHVFSDVLNDLGAPTRFEQHLGRAAQVHSEEADLSQGESIQQVANKAKGSGFSFDINDFAHSLSPSTWISSWRETTNGEQTIDPAIDHQLKKSLDPNTYALAKQIAQGYSQAHILGNTSGQNRINLVQQMNSPDVQKAVSQFNAAHLSLGRALVGQQFLVQHPDMGKKLSGGIDAAYDVAADPTLKAGKVADVLRIDKYGARAGEATDQIAANAAKHLSEAKATISPDGFTPITGQAAGSVGTGDAVRAEGYALPDTTAWAGRLQQPEMQRWTQTIGNHIEKTGSIMSAERLDSRVGTMAQAMSDANVHDAASLHQFLLSEGGVKAIMQGDAAMQHSGVAMLPHLTRTGWAAMQAKGLTARAIDWASEKGPDLRGHVFAPGDLSTGSTMGDAHLDATKGFPGTGEEFAHPDGMPNEREVRGNLASLGVRGVTMTPRAIKRMTQATPKSGVMDLTSDDAPVMLKQLLSYSLPAAKVNSLVDYFMSLSEKTHEDWIGQRFLMYKGAVKQMLVHAGVDLTSSEATEMMDTVEQSFRAGTYATNNLDKMKIRGQSIPAGIGLNQMNQFVHVPSFKNVRDAARRDTFYRSMGNGAVPGTVDKMMKYWKIGVLLRIPGFALRVALGDEAFSGVLRNGLGGFLHARMANKAVKSAEDLAREDMTTPEGKVGAALHAITSNIPAPLVAQAKSGHELATLAWAHATHAFYKAGGGTKTLHEYMDGADSYYKHISSGESALADEVMSVNHGGGSGDPERLAQTMLDGGDVVNLSAKRTGIYTETVKGSDPLFLHKWHFQLNQIAHDTIGRRILGMIQKGDSKGEQAEKVYQDLARRDAEGESTIRKSARYNQDSEGGIVGHNITREDALRDWAGKYVEWVHTALKEDGHVAKEDVTGNGPLRDLVDSMLPKYDDKGKRLSDGMVPDADTLAKIPNDIAPKRAYGQEWTAVHGPDRLAAKGFHINSRIIDWISREPLTLHAYTEALPETRKIASALLGKDADPENVEKLAAQMASKRALGRVKPYIHSPEIRSQFEVMHRVSMPFLFAQDQFIKRWSKTFIDSPEGIRKAQLMMHGLETSGVVHKDQNGNDIFTYPLSGVATRVITTTLAHIGIGASMPVSVPWTGAMNDLAPGLNNPLTPAVGPAVAIPLKALASRDPGLQQLQQNVLGPGASTGYLDQVLPSTLSRILTAVHMDPQSTSQYASAQMQAMQMLEANGMGYNEHGNHETKQQYLDRLDAWTKNLFFTKAILGFIVPASPTANFDPKNLDPRFRQLIGELGFNDGLNEFMREQPDASPYTVFTSTTTGDVPNLPSTKAAGDFMNAHSDFVKNNPLAAGWFIPRTMGNEPFDPAAYRVQINDGLRSQKLPSQFLDDITKAAPARVYYQSEQNYYNAYNQTKSTQMRQQMRQSYDLWKSTFLAQNPTFADYVTSGGSAVKRDDALREVRTVLSNGTAPAGPQTDHIKVLMQSFQNYEQQFSANLGNYSHTATQKQANLKTSFTGWAQQYIAANPDVADFYTVLLQPELGQNAFSQGVINAG